MTFAAPLWLIALAPLAAVVLYLLWGRRRQEPVPFLDLWRGPVKGPRPKRQLMVPPLALWLAVMGMLLAVLSAAGPAVWNPTGAAPLTIIVDRGATMSAGNRMAEAAQAAQRQLARLPASTPVDLVIVPADVRLRIPLSGWLSGVTPLPRTAVDTTAQLNATVARGLWGSTGPVLVVTDRDVRASSDRIVRVTPATNVANAGIVLLAARQSPAAQVMVRVRSAGRSGPAQLRVSTAGRDVVREIELPPDGQTADHFIDFEALGDVVKAELQVDDDFGADDAAWLVREGSPPRLEPRGSVPQELHRMINVYASSRPPTGESQRVIIVRDTAALAPESSGVVLAEARDQLAPPDAQVRPHPVTRDTTWTLAEPIRLAAGPGEGWTPVVTIGGRVAVAVRESPARQVWVGMASDEWPRTPQYVVFWANVFDWVGGGEVRYQSRPVGRLEGRWDAVELAGAHGPTTRPGAAADLGLWPGLYRREEDGALRAVNVGEVHFPRVLEGDDWRPRLERVLDEHARGAARPLAGGVLLAAGLCVALATAFWKRSAGRNLAAT